jgi:aspartokinase/homoserine dehydrogenase 1
VLEERQTCFYYSITASEYIMLTGGATSATTFAFDNELGVVASLPGGIASFKDSVILYYDYAHHMIFYCTGGKEDAKLHAGWLNEGVHVAKANNWGLAGSKEQRDAIAAAEIGKGKLSAKYLPEVKVGGALPVINILRSLLNSGDIIHRVDGMISVSMSYIMFRISPPVYFDCNTSFDERISNGVFSEEFSSNVGEVCSLSQAVKEAVALGLMEDDPGKDLNNEYTSRCLMILAKELGVDHNTSMQEIQEVGEKLVDGDVDFTNITEEVDQKVQEKVKAALDKGCVLRHIASVDVTQEQIEIKLLEVPNTHIFAITPPGCECVRLFTERHIRYPVIIQGPSAGADSTASAPPAEFLSHVRSRVSLQVQLPTD